jgi:hypothetical protein
VHKSQLRCSTWRAVKNSSHLSLWRLVSMQIHQCWAYVALAYQQRCTTRAGGVQWAGVTSVVGGVQGV